MRDVPEFMQILPRNEKAAVYQDVALFIRALIDNGRLTGGETLPSLRKLAEAWNISYYSIQQATEELMLAGLLYKYPGREITVSPKRSGIHCIGLYSSRQASDNGEYGFYDRLRDILYRKIQERGLECVIWFDSRAPEEQNTVPQYLTDAINSNKIQAVIGVLLGSGYSWFRSLPTYQTNVHDALLGRDDIHSIPKIVKELNQHDFKRIGIICPESSDQKHAFPLDAIREHGVKLMPRYQRKIPSYHPDYPTYEEYGYHLTMDLLNAKLRPDALLVYPDHAARGAIIAIKECGIKVPEDLFVVFHRNSELDYFCPFSVCWQDTSIANVADILLDNLLQS